MAPWTPIRPAPFQRWQPRNEITRARLESPSPEELREMRPDYDPALFDPTAARGGHTHDPSHPSHYNPDQPRVSAGHSDGGQWTSEGFEDGDAIETQVAANGHHFVVRALYGKTKYSFRPEVVKFFKEANTGRLHDPSSNKFDKVHQAYSQAVQEGLDRFLERNKIRGDQMTVNQAGQFLDEILRSLDPRIQRFNFRLMTREIFKRHRIIIPSRGTE